PVVSPTQPTKIRAIPKAIRPAAAAPVPVAAPLPHETSSPWTELTSDTDAPSAQAEDTMKGSGRRLRRREGGKKESRWNDRVFRRSVIMGAVAALLILSAVGVYFLFIRDTTQKPTPGKSHVENNGNTQVTPDKPAVKTGVIYVSKSKAEPGDLDSLEAAIARATSGDRIVVRDQEVYEERLEILASKGKRGIS